MEEWVGGLWDRFITRAARRDHPAAAVRLEDMQRTLGVMFRAMGGDAGLRVAPAMAARHGARRRLLERIAGTGEKVEHAALDAQTLRLPAQLAWFAEPELNRELYLWLAALAAAAGPGAFGREAQTSQDWLVGNQRAVLQALARFPGLRRRYEGLVEAVLLARIAPEHLPASEAAAEQMLRQALRDPGSVTQWPGGVAPARPLQPVPLWLYPALPQAQDKASSPGGEQQSSGAKAAEGGAHHAERVETPEHAAPLLMMFRAESLLSWAEYVKVNRDTDSDDNPDAARAAQGMDQLSLADGDMQRAASTVRFDLDLPSPAADDIVLEDGILLPEWDWRARQLKPAFCSLQVMSARSAEPVPLPPELRAPARRLKNQFAALAPARRWQKAQPDGSEVDLDACVRLRADRLAGVRSAADVYRAQTRPERDLACLVLADLSLSTDAWISDSQRVIDVIRDSLMLFGEALGATGDAFAFHGFSSLKRSLVRFHDIKDFSTRFDAAARGRIAALKPGYYTRMGAAVRHASSLLGRRHEAVRLLLLLTDGKPHDIDHYEGRYGIEDTRQAVHEARAAGLKPFCVTIDREGASYLGHVFGPGGYTVVRRPQDLPQRLPQLYARLTA